MSTGSRGNVQHSDRHTTKQASTRRFQVILLAIVAATALVMSACAPTPPVSTNLRPLALASADVTTGSAPLVVQFSSAGSSDADGTISSYSWNFGDGSPVSSAADPTHTYLVGGTFLATLTVTDNSGSSSSATVSLIVGANSNQSPVAVITATAPPSNKAPASFAFSSVGSADPDGSIVSYRWDWGDGTPFGTAANPSHTFNTAGTFIVTLTVTDNFGATGSATTSVSTVANLAPDAVATVSSPIAIAPATLSFNSSGSTDADGIIVTRRWNFGDGSPLSTSANPTKNYANPGNYVVTLTVIDDSGASDVASLNIAVLTVNQAPVAVANGTPVADKAPLTVNFSSAGSVDNDGSIVGYSWNFGDGSPLSTDANPTHTYTDPGSYTAVLTVTDNRLFPSPGTATASVPITVGPFNLAPVATGSVTPTSGKIPLPVTFSSVGSVDSDGSIVSYSWAFGDGDTSADPNPAHTYANPGTYTAVLTVTDDDGATAMVPVTVIRVLNVFPTAAVAATPTSGKGPLAVDFSSAGTDDSDGTIASYAWDFQTDGIIDSTSANPSFTFAPGNYTASLTVTDDSGDSDTKTVSIVSNPNVLPTAVANSDIASGNAPLAVAFSSVGSDDADGTITGYSWNFGDGSPLSTAPSPAHTYTVAGSYSAVVTVTDSDGDTSSAALTIEVNPNPAPVSAISVSSVAPTSTKVPATYTFASTGSSDDGSIVDYSWSWGDGTPDGSGASPSHTYTTVGSFVATLTVTDNGGLSTSASTIVDTIPNLSPTASASATPNSGKAPLTVALSSAGSIDPDGTITDYSWNFGDGSPASTDPNPTKTYGVGTFTATLTVTDDDGNTGTATAAVATVANQVPVAVANATPTGTKAPLPVAFSSAGSVDNDGSIAAYAWDFDNNGSVDSTDPNPSSVYATPGLKTARLTLTDDSGDTGFTTVSVNVGAENVAPNANPTATPSSGKRPLAVVLSSATSTDSDGTVDSYLWDFGDGSPTSTDANPSHTYAVGTWTATLTVTDNDGATNTDTVTINSNPNQAPTAQASATPPSGKRPLAVVFSSAGSTDPDDSIASYAWDFGDGDTSTDANPSHSYAVGNWVATLTVTDEEGLTGTHTVNISSNPNQAPVAVANSNKNVGLAPSTVAFSSVGSLDADDSIASYAWDFGDGSPVSTDANPSHTYTDAGLYTATLTVTDQEGLTGTATKVFTAVDEFVFVSTTGNDGSAGTKAAPKLTIQAALTAAAANAQNEVRVAGGSYGSFTVQPGVDVVGGFDQSFVADGGNGATTVTVTGAANTPGVTATGATVPTKLKNLTIQGGSGNTAAGSTGVLALTSSNLTLDTVTVDSGTPSTTGSSAYGVRSLSGSVVTVKDSTVTAQGGVAGTNATAGTAGTNGTNGNNGTTGTSLNSSAPGAAVTGTPTTRNGGAGAGGGGGDSQNLTGTTQVAGSAGAAGGGGAAGGTAGPASTGSAGGGGGGAAGTAGAAGTGGTTTNAPGDIFVGGTGTTGAAGTAAFGGGGGGSGSGVNTGSLSGSGGRRQGGGGGGGGLAGTGGTGGGAGTPGGGSFGVFSNNASVTVTGTTITTGNGGKGGNGGAGSAGGTGGNGGNGGSPDNTNTGVGAGGGGGGGGGAGGTGGSGGGGGTGGPSIGAYSVGSGLQVVSTTTATLGTRGAGGDAGVAGAGGTAGAAGAAGTTNTASRNGAVGNAGATRVGNAGAVGADGARTARVNANQAPVAVASAAPLTGRSPLVVTFSSTGSVDTDGTIVSYSWNFGDGSPTSSSPNPTHTYTGTTARTAVLTVTDDNGATSTSSVVISPTVNQAPTAVVNASPQSGVRPLPVNFSSAGSVDTDGTIVSYSWDFGNGDTSTDADPSYTYIDPGGFTATLTVTDNEGGTGTASVAITSRPPNVSPVAAASATPTSGRKPLTVAFSSAGSADSDGTIASRSWDFGNGDTSTSANPDYTYTSSGTYTAVLTVTDNEGATGSQSVTITVDPNVAPTAVAGSDVSSGQAPLQVAFSSAGSNDSDGTIASYSWDFGAGQGTSTNADPTKTYNSAGTFTATLTVTDDNGATATSSVIIEVGAPNQAPAAAVTAAPTSGKEPLTVSFDGTGSTDADGTVNQYAWTFGDGGTSSSSTPSRTYTSAGTYTATLTVTDNQGATNASSVTITVNVNQAPTAAAQVSPSSGKTTFTTFTFGSVGSGDPDGTSQFSWNFGDGSPSDNTASPTKTYNAAGTYPVTLTVTADDNGATATSSVNVTVVDNVAPTAAAQVTPATGKTNIATFTFGSVGTTDPDGTFTRSWNFGDGSPAASTASPTKVYSTAGTYNVVLTVTDDNGAVSTAAVTVNVLDNVAPTASPTVNLTSGTTATNFNFTANGADSDGTVTAHLWTFGDGTFATTANPVNKKFNTPGTYNVTVRVTDNNGAQTTSAPITITVS